MYKSTMLAVADNETLCRWHTAIILSTAFTIADLTKAYTLAELVNDRTFFMKFDATEQRKAGRTVCEHTIAWWKSDKVTEEARKASLHPNPELDQPMSAFRPAFMAWCHERGISAHGIDFCDRNLFDLSKLQHMMEVTLGAYGSEPWDYHNISDVVSTLKAWGADRYAGINARELEGMVYHDPRYDAALDWLRWQKTAWTLGLLEVEGWVRDED